MHTREERLPDEALRASRAVRRDEQLAQSEREEAARKVSIGKEGERGPRTTMFHFL